MSSLTITSVQSHVVVEIGGMPIRFSVGDPAFREMLKERYAGFISPTASPRFDFDIELIPLDAAQGNGDVQVDWISGRWYMDRADFHAEWNPETRHGLVRQTANPYSIDCVLRIVHTLLLSSEAGFLVHSASAIRNGRAVLFAGESGAGKTTIARLAPSDTTLLSDEISYVCQRQDRYCAYGTPFTGELGRAGENVSAPIAAIYFLVQGPENETEKLGSAESVRALLENILFFARDSKAVQRVFQAACDFASRVPAHRLTFAPNPRVWEMVS